MSAHAGVRLAVHYIPRCDERTVGPSRSHRTVAGTETTVIGYVRHFQRSRSMGYSCERLFVNYRNDSAFGGEGKTRNRGLGRHDL